MVRRIFNAAVERARVFPRRARSTGPARFPPAATNSGSRTTIRPTIGWAMRALLVAMEAWVRDGTAPPESRFPRLADGTLVARRGRVPGSSRRQLTASADGWLRARRIRSLRRTARPVRRCRFSCHRSIRTESNSRVSGCPRSRRRSRPLPAGTFATLRSAARARCIRCSAPTSRSRRPPRRAPRRKTRAPRIAERYASKQAYLEKIEAAGDKLVADRYLLPEDMPAVLDRAGRHFDLLTGAH